MAVLTLDFLSKTMRRQVTVNAYIPAEALEEGEKVRTLYLLHGVNGSYANWMTVTNLFQLAGQFNLKAVRAGQKRLAVIMPGAGNGFYQPVPYLKDPSRQQFWGHWHDYEAFVGEELVTYTRSILPLSDKKEDTMIAGLSMGGYGALITALRYPKTFSLAGGFSSALVTRKTAQDLKNSGFFGQPEFLEVLFGDYETARQDPNMDVQKKIESLLQAGGRGSIPRIYLSCGTEDSLLGLSRELNAFLEENEIFHRYEEHTGGHDWTFWSWSLERLLGYILEEDAGSTNSQDQKEKPTGRPEAAVTQAGEGGVHGQI